MANRHGKSEIPEQNSQNNMQNPTPAATAIPAYLEAAARLSTSRPLGAPRVDTDIAYYYTIGQEGHELHYSHTKPVPGFIVLDYMPTLGISENATSPLNRASFYEFNKIREKISGNRSYEPVDHMIYRQCVDGLRELYAYIRRAYTIISSYSALNMYKPRHIMKGMGLDFDDWNTNAASVYQWLCNHKSSLTPFPTVPIGKISARREAYNSAMFLDGDSPTAQTYIFNQIGFYSYESVDQVKGISIARPSSGKVSAFFALWDRLYTALQSSSDVYTIAADIRRAFEERVVTDLTPPAVDQMVEYIKLDPVLTNIMNATTLLTYIDGADTQLDETKVANAFRIYDGGNGILKCNGSFELDLQDAKSPNETPVYIHSTGFLKHLNFVEPNPDVTAVINAVRFKPVVDSNIAFETRGDGSHILVNTTVSAVGTEVIIAARCFQLLNNNELIDVTHPSTVSLYYNAAAVDIVEDLSMTCNFDWIFPQFFVSMSDPMSYSSTVEDIQNYVPISREVLSNILNALLLSEFEIPG